MRLVSQKEVLLSESVHMTRFVVPPVTVGATDGVRNLLSLYKTNQ
jgi:hypothetical protein